MGDSEIIRKLENYNYAPEGQTLEKMKYYYGSVNPIRGFRKFMELSPIPLKDAEPTWSRVSRYIVFNKEGILKKYSNPVYIPLKDVEGDEEVLNHQKVSKKEK